MQNKGSDLSEQDKKDIEDSVDSGSDILDSEDSDQEQALAMTEEKTKALAVNVPGLPIEGLQGVPVNILPVPFVKLVQGLSQNIALEDGADAPLGSFYFTDTQKAVKELNFVMLRARQYVHDFERDGKIVPTRLMSILGITNDVSKKLFVLTLSISSFSSFGRLMAKFKDLGITRAWEYSIIATSEKKKNDKGQFLIMNFQVGEKLDEKELSEMEEAYSEYGGVLERQEDPDMEQAEQ